METGMLRDHELTIDANPISPVRTAGSDTFSKIDADSSPILARLMHVSRIFRALEGCRLVQLGLFPGQDDCLLALDLTSPTTNSKLARRLGVNPSTVSKMVDRMAQADLVERRSDPKDQRGTLICLTVAGNEVRAQVAALRDQTEAEFAQAFGSNRTLEIARAMQRISSIIQRDFSRTP